MKNKIITAFLCIFFIVVFLNSNNVFGIGVIGQSWTINSDGETCLIFRLFTAPHEASTVNTYYQTQSSIAVENDQWTYKAPDGTTPPSKWIDSSIMSNLGAYSYPSITTFKTIGFVFHTKPMGDYTQGGSIGYNSSTKTIGREISSIETSYYNSEAKYTEPKSVADYNDSENYNEIKIFELMKSTGTYTKVNWGTGLTISETQHANYIDYRYAIVAIDGHNVIINDYIIYSENLKQLIQAAKEKGVTASCYISNIITSKSLNTNNPIEVARTLERFFNQYGGKIWGDETQGKTSKALGSVANLYDNQIVFPQLAKRSVMVRHINVGTNTVISTEIIDNAIGNGGIIKSNDRRITTTNPDGTIERNTLYNGKDYPKYINSEYYPDALDMEQGMSKTALTSDKYKCIGNNMAIGSSWNTAIGNIDTKIRNREFEKATSVSVPGKDTMSESDYIVIDFYYTEYDKDVEVNHIYLDQNGYIREIAKQTIVPNQSALEGNKSINRTNTNKYVSEIYAKRKGVDITVRTADSLASNADVTYLGYENLTSRTNVKDIVGTQRTRQDFDGTTNTAKINGDTVQVNFYYQIENIRQLPEPEKTIEGSVFVAGKYTQSTTTCQDTEQLELAEAVTSIPSGAQATIGVQGIPKYMLAAVRTEYVSPMNNIYTTGSLDIDIKMGTQTKKVNFNKIQYRAGYYKVTDMAVYKLNNVTVYDAGNSGTVGSGLFDWNEKTATPKNMKLNVAMTGIDGKKISNEDIDKVQNYVAIKFVDKNGNEFQKSKVYLTSEQLAEVDANSDGKVTAEDKIKAEEILSGYNDTLTNKKKEEATKQAAYDSAVKQESNLKNAYEDATKELERLHGVYDDATNSKTAQWTNISKLTGEINALKGKIETLKDELEVLETAEQTAKTSKEQAEDKYANVLARQTELYNIYLAEVENRNRLAAAANCRDKLDDEIYLYVEIYKELIDAANKCSEAKREYEKNKEDKVVENALETYNNYTDNELALAQQSKDDAENTYETAKSDRENKEIEITSKGLELVAKENTYSMLYKQYETFISETYTPAKKAYESYRDNEYATAENAYNSYVAGDYIKIALEQLNAAKDQTQEAQETYDKYNRYTDNLLNKFNEYKALYDEFDSIDTNNPAAVAELLGLNLKINVQNMSVKITVGENTDGAVEIKSNNDTAQKTFRVADLLKNPGSTVYQVYVNERPQINKSLYSGIEQTTTGNKAETKLLTPEDYNDYRNKVTILEKTTNGVRALSGKVTYKTEIVIGNKKATIPIKDNTYYATQSNSDETVEFNLTTKELTKTYQVKSSASNDEEKYKETKPVNVYTPITVDATMNDTTSQIVNQIKDQEMAKSVIQLNAPFTITLNNKRWQGQYKINDTTRYSGGFYIKFGFDVHNVKINGKTYRSGNRIPADTWIGLIQGEAPTITAQPYGNLEGDEQGVISEENSYYTVRTVAYNATDVIRNKSLQYDTLKDISEGELKNTISNICAASNYPAPYFAQITKDVIIVNRAYDFRITDIKDVNWKDVFRYSTASKQNVNTHKEIVYYAGNKKWDTTSSKTNEIINRTSAEIGRNPLRILPVGPYKNTDSTYIKAPKIGYRFSFDMKVTGSYYKGSKVNEDKSVNIMTKFYYISKDGKTYIPEVNEEKNGTKSGIYLFYKTSSGKYVRIDEENGGGYELRFTPNDGYRYIDDSQKSTLSQTSVKLGNLREINLIHNMATVSNNGAIITYYGEYKLPNSTIAVAVDEFGNYDINKPLTNGYIGVVFDISAKAGKMTVNKETTDVELSYSKDTNGDNTSQWDYEGFLGFTKPGSLVQDTNPLTLKLEKGTWKINNSRYQEIKGTVMLYDLDERAATDYE